MCGSPWRRIKKKEKVDTMVKYSPKAEKKIRKVIHEYKMGELKSGLTHKKVTNPKQALAIGLSEARRLRSKAPKRRGK